MAFLSFARKSRLALCGILAISLSGAPAWAADQGAARSVNSVRPAPCLNLPVSSELVNPASCFITGPTSMVVTGTVPESASDGTAVLVDTQVMRRATAPGSGRLTIRDVRNGHACMVTARGEATDLDIAAMQIAHGACSRTSASATRSGANASQEVIASAQAGSGPPQPASSYYVYGAFVAECGPTATSGCPLYVDGADEVAPPGGALVVLDFGAPCYVQTLAGPVYGAQLFLTQTCTTDDQLPPLAQAFLRGYQSTHGSGTPLAIVALGTSNAVTGANTNPLGGAMMQDSGKAWFQNVVQPFAAAATGPAPIVTWGASDIEQSSDTATWYGPNESTAWVDGYSTAALGALGNKRCSGNDPFRMADYGDDVVGGGGWTQAQIFHVAWGAAASCAVPEIYVSANGPEWQQTSQWGVANGKGPIPFTGPMSLGGEGGYLSTQDSWNNLASATGQSPPYLTDIGSLFTSPPGPPSNIVALAGDQSATVWWSPTRPASDGGSPVQHYVVTAYAGSSPGPSTTVRGLPPPTTAIVRGLTNGTSYIFVVAATNSAGTGAGSQPSNAVVPGPGRYHPVSPTRILDTRNGIGGSSPLGPQSQLTLQVTGTSPVPSSGVAAVVLNVAVTDTTASSYLTAFPAQIPRPLAANLNWTAGATVGNLVEVAIGPSGGVSFFNAVGTVDIIADVEGYVGTADAPAGPDGLYAHATPTRVLDTRIGTSANPTLVGAVGPGQTIHVAAAQLGQGAVTLNVTVTSPTRQSYLTVWPDGDARPVVSNLNFAAGQTIGNRVMVKVGSNGKVSIYNAAGSVQVIADLNGSFTDASPGGVGASFQGVQPTRTLDTRDGTGGFRGALGPGGKLIMPVAGDGVVPAGATAVVANLTVTDTTAQSYMTAWPDGTTQPTVSDLNWAAGTTVPNLLVVKLGPNGNLDLYNAAGSTDVIIDVVGWYR